jgi:tetraacyldisaccharide 4'-kinase
MWQSLHDAWWRLATLDRPQSFPDTLACHALELGAAAYSAAVMLRNRAYDEGWLAEVRLPCLVISVGNLTVGGTGKTACVQLIASRLARQGKRVAVLSRGYGGNGGEYWLKSDNGQIAFHGAEENSTGLADEPQLLANQLPGVPVVVGPQRAKSGQMACAKLEADTVILDDGFQHRQLRRDCDIVLIHSRMPFDGWGVLPRGPMREPLSSLRRAHVLMITKADENLETLGALSERLRAFNRDAAVVTAAHAPVSLAGPLSGEILSPKHLEGMRVGLLSSIGDPAGFESTVQRLHATIAWHRQFPDHHPYRQSDWLAVAESASQSRPEAILTTEKDWVRLEPVARASSAAGVPLWVLGVRMQILSGEQELDDRLAGLSRR